MAQKINNRYLLLSVTFIFLVVILLFTLIMGWNERQELRAYTISRVPYVIKQSGNYALDRNLICSGSEVACIEIKADYVTLDLNGFKLGCSSQEPGRNTYGIYAKNQSYITIRNGMVEGFFYGVYFEDISRDGKYQPENGWHTVEKIVARKNTFRGIRMEGLCNTALNNIVASTGGTRYYKDAFAIGIESIGSNALIKHNRVFETYGTDNGEAVGISLTGTGDASWVSENLISNTEPPANDSWGIWASGDTGPFIINNTIYGYKHGLGLASEAHGLFEGNLIYGAEVPAVVRAPVVDGGNNRAIMEFGKNFSEFYVTVEDQQ